MSSFNDLHTSEEDGKPIDLVEFNVGASTFRFTNNHVDLTVLSNNYEAVAMTRDEAQIGIEARLQTININLPTEHPFSQRYLGIPPGQKTTGSIKLVERDNLTDVRTEFLGLLRSVAFDDLGDQCRIAMMPLTGALLRAVPRFLFSGMCNHVLYDSGCAVVQSTFQHTNTGGTTSDPRIITVAGLDSAEGVGWATGGFVQFAGSNDFRGVFRHLATNSLVIPVPFRDDVTGQTLDVFAGCDHDFLGDCSNTKFNNQERHGGFPFVPTKNPYRTKINQNA